MKVNQVMLRKSASLIIIGLLVTYPLSAANRVTTWSSGQVLTASNLNDEVDNIYTGTIDRSGGRWGNNDDIPIVFGSSQDAQIEWETAQTVDSLILGTGAGGIFSVMEKADMATDWGLGSQTNPTIFVHSADASATTDFISITHDQTNAVISNGIGSINLVVEGSTADGYETTVTFTDPTADQTVTIANATGTVMLTSVAANGADLANSVTGAANALLYEGATADGYETTLTVTDPTADRTVTLADAGGTVMLTSVAANGADLANAVTGAANALLFEGATANGYETTLTVTDPTADRTITLPDGGGTVVITGGTDLTVADGGTGASTFTDGGVLLGSGTGAITALSVLGDGEIVIGDGSGDPVALDVGSSTSITILGTIATGTWQATDVGVGYGGTGASSFTDGGVLLGSGSGALTPMSVLSDSELIVGDGTGDPVAESGATLRTSIGVGTGDSPQFTALTLTAATVATLEGATADGYETSIVVTDPTADRTITLQNASGTVAFTSDLTGGTDVTVADGGTGASSLTDGGVLLGSGTDPVTVTAVLADGEILIGDGSTDPVALDVGSSSSITVLGTVATGTWQATDVGVAYGGTGASSLTDGGILLGSGTGAITALGVAANGQIPIGDGSTDPQLATLTGTSNEVTVTNGGGSITLSIPDASIFVTPRATGVAEFNDTVLIGANGTSLDGHVHILSPSTGTAALVLEVPASSTTPALDMHYNGTSAWSMALSATTSKLFIAGRDLGNDVTGPMFQAERNTHSGGVGSAPAVLALQEVDGGWGFIWVEADNTLKIHTSAPTGSEGSPTVDENAGTVVGAQTSPEYIKNILFTYPNIPGDLAYEKFQAVLDTPIKEFTFKGNKHYGQQFTGMAIPDGEHPWYGVDTVKSLNDIAPMGTAKHLNELSIPGYLILSIKVLNKKIEDLENEINRLHSNRSSDLALNR